MKTTSWLRSWHHCQSPLVLQFQSLYQGKQQLFEIWQWFRTYVHVRMDLDFVIMGMFFSGSSFTCMLAKPWRPKGLMRINQSNYNINFLTLQAVWVYSRDELCTWSRGPRKWGQRWGQQPGRRGCRSQPTELPRRLSRLILKWSILRNASNRVIRVWERQTLVGKVMGNRNHKMGHQNYEW